MAAPRENVSLLFKLYCLAVMTLVAAAYTIALRYTRTSDRELYFSTTAVCITEVIKLLLSVGILAKHITAVLELNSMLGGRFKQQNHQKDQASGFTFLTASLYPCCNGFTVIGCKSHVSYDRETGSLGRFKASLRDNVLGSPKELMKLSVPSLVYAVQNNMAFLALSNLDAAVYQVTYQLKIPCTALCTVLMLNRTLSKLQWISVFMLCGGVILVQWKPAQATKVVVEQNPLLGFGAIAIAVLCSGFAGVYFEKVLKSSDTSLWVRNIQMYLSGIVVTLVGVYLSDGAEIKEKGFFYGYTYYVWFVIFLASVGGLYTSVVVKYTDNIMKGFSAAAAIVLSTIASVMLFGLQITPTFALGTLLVCVSIYLYGLPRQDTTSIQQGETASKERVSGV
ncbi:CMP-sialic acid transporter isoform X2 [Suricata suricatta]|uniref:CMP-sialic acid transporter isoform X2 n=1 Tax=Suricata suricatta TaxID=37032 RepID=UPI0011557B18|nr:CMP-sialic acid transporter isoform X2 [Suricata suricatta]